MSAAHLPLAQRDHLARMHRTGAELPAIAAAVGIDEPMAWRWVAACGRPRVMSDGTLRSADICRTEYAADLGATGDAFGVSREAIRQLEVMALRTLRSPSHRIRVRARLATVTGRLRRARLAGQPLEEQLALADEAEDLCGAIDWLEAYASGELGGQLQDVLAREGDDRWELLEGGP